MTVRNSLRWELDLPDPGELLSADERDERRKLAWIVLALLLAGVVTTSFVVWALMI